MVPAAGKDSPPSTKDSLTRIALILDRKRSIEEARKRAQSAQIENYAENFQEKAEKAAVVLAEVPIEVLNEEQEQIQSAIEKKAAEERAKYEAQIREVNSLKEESEDQLCHKEEVMKNQIVRNEKNSIRDSERKHGLIKGAFSRAETTLHEYLAESKSQVNTIYKDLSMDYKSARHNMAGSKEGKDPNAWRYKEQLIEIDIVCLRCVKDKLPKGRYAILCSIIDRLGGNVIEVKRKHSKKWRRVTAPKPHSGEYHLNNLVFNQPVLLHVPPRTKVRPSMAILFELFLLKSKDYAHDQVLGWGAFPLIGADFELNKGKFKVRLLLCCCHGGTMKNVLKKL